MTTNNGGPAFPNEGFNGWGRPDQGMTLRDYMAAKAMQALVSGFLAAGEAMPMEHDKILARRSYEMADAMLKEREQPDC